MAWQDDITQFWVRTTGRRIDPVRDAWLLNRIFSRRLQQLNLPLNPLDTAMGLRSRVIKLRDPVSRTVRYTIWYRIIKRSGDVIYSGVYTACAHPRYDHPLLKVIFPLPNGSASVVMDRVIEADGSLLLRSDGRYFGANGFYFTVTDRRGRWWARFVRAMHEWIRVYEDDEGVLRADHHLRFFGFRLLELHYKMVRFR
ncbi:hypothetical protein [Lewinella sp. IMCC34191]|uniref:hypothetical protein n=1 Tax=Lewinella sp. IMCC34191 TaxID=2259172 RepID=UPI000E25F42D|nr:hypothetical protein [Lewinella sp. IMCC34191]